MRLSSCEYVSRDNKDLKISCGNCGETRVREVVKDDGLLWQCMGCKVRQFIPNIRR
jgi:uncharacterized Zn finger protein